MAHHPLFRLYFMGFPLYSNLPDNLKQLFRAVAMVVPDRKLIAQVGWGGVGWGGVGWGGVGRGGAGW